MPDAFALRTPRLELSVPTHADIDAIFAIHSDPRTYEHRPELTMKTRDEAVELARAWQNNWADQQLGYYTVRTLDGATIGFTGVRHSEEADEEVLNLYYRFAPESQGQGYAKEAAAAAIASARERFPTLPIVAIIDPANQASIGLAVRLGLQHVPGAGFPDDYEVYRLS
ncbi:GNAT family N-acetyltransferase [Corynebacterium lujinxingii]|uniref:GNAT family N-acetyltransferase n=1 Tax=Corynebacterium lujinxingii TaxID=2763010 RepID=A0A7H0JZG7_9CORY|nr:GNAT family N-acetyltransferase [Corynebacterium lujinxingii]MBC3179605.1 GNAT family N-acetyltransferase [Corynebacterium lujinxingii]NNO10297.1 GNAT family N-acetyltransferase [Corynebacterium lujinxingii]QNP90433.1 GNAT family N-acetyltransferase [Corynebacterium lujinxingii]